MTISELTPGFVFYTATITGFNWYEYVAPMPVKPLTSQNKYFILIDKQTERPIRMYHVELQRLLDQNLFTLKGCLKRQLELAKDWVSFLESEINKHE